MMAALDTSCVDMLLAEAKVPADKVAEVLEGFEDYLSLDIDIQSKTQLEALRSRYTTRLNKSRAVQRVGAEFKAAIEILVADGHPNEPEAVVDREVIEDMRKQLATLSAAFARFAPRPITTGGKLVVGEQEAKK